MCYEEAVGSENNGQKDHVWNVELRLQEAGPTRQLLHNVIDLDGYAHVAGRPSRACDKPVLVCWDFDAASTSVA